MTKSTEVIDYIKNNLDSKNFETIFAAGSLPDELIGGSDLDIFCIIKSERKNEFFEDIKEKMDKFLKNKPKLKYSFFRGPIKYKNKGLIHFLVYTHEDNPKDLDSSELFINELRQILKSYLSTGIVLCGKKLQLLMKNINLNDEQAIIEGISKTRKKYEILKKTNTINFPQWKKTSKGWKLLRTRIVASQYFRKYLIGSFEKKMGLI